MRPGVTRLDHVPGACAGRMCRYVGRVPVALEQYPVSAGCHASVPVATGLRANPAVMPRNAHIHSPLTTGDEPLFGLCCPVTLGPACPALSCMPGMAHQPRRARMCVRYSGRRTGTASPEKGRPRWILEKNTKNRNGFSTRDASGDLPCCACDLLLRVFTAARPLVGEAVVGVASPCVRVDGAGGGGVGALVTPLAVGSVGGAHGAFPVDA